MTCDTGYTPNTAQNECERVLAQCEFNGSQYSDSQTVSAYKFETSATCSEVEQKTCDGLTGAFNKPLYTHGACNKWCEPPTGWLSLSGQSKVEHGQVND